MSGSAHIIELRIVNDVELELGLAKIPGAMSTLCYLADRGGEMPWSDTTPVKPQTIAMLDDLARIEVIEWIDRSVAHLDGHRSLRLTSKGRNVVELHRKRKVEIGSGRDVSAEEAAAMARSPRSSGIIDGSQGPSTVHTVQAKKEIKA